MDENIKELMDQLTTDILNDATKYLEQDEQLGDDDKMPELIPLFVVEQFKLHRNYPSSYTDEKIYDDLMKHKNTLVMMAIDCYSHYGAEGEVNHNEKNISRSYENPYISDSLLNRVVPFVDFFNY